MASNGLIFLKLGGSLLTDKTAVEALRSDVLARVAKEIAVVRRRRPDLALVIGHGSGSFGHTVAATYGTRQRVVSAEEWTGFCRVSAAAARLNRIVCEAFLNAGVATVSLQPSASARCRDGVLVEMATGPVQAALDAGIVPLLYGDVAFDRRRGGTIISTEQVLGFVAAQLKPAWLLLAGDTQGVYGADGDVIKHITKHNFAQIRDALGGSAGTDVTGGMEGKVRDMLQLAESDHELSIRIFSGSEPGNLRQLLLDPRHEVGTLITA